MHSAVKQLRTAVIGLGRIGWQFHLPEIDSHKEFNLVAVADPLEDRINEAKSKYDVKGYVNYLDMLKAEQLDLVVVASPTKFHLKQVLDAFEFGCDVFCEKPVVPSLEQMDQIIEAKNRTGRKFMAFQPHRSFKELVCLKHILSLGLLGETYMIKRCSSDYNRRSDWQAFLSNGGGMLNNYGSHFIDQLLCLADSNVASVQCITRTVACLGDADDVVKAVFEMDDGLVLDFDINMASAFKMSPWQVLGKNGSAILDENSSIWRVKYYLPSELEDVSVNPELAAKDRSYSNGETIPWRLKEFSLDDFDAIDYYQKCYDYFALDQKPFVDISESRRLIEVIGMCKKSSQKA